MPKRTRNYWTVDPETGCWNWNLSLQPTGYGRVRIAGRMVLAHRWSYETHVGPIPEGLQIDHLCRNRACVNPAHLEPVTARENVLRGEGPAALHVRKTHCVNGHEFSPANTRHRHMPNGQTSRTCRTCANNHALRVIPGAG